MPSAMGRVDGRKFPDVCAGDGAEMSKRKRPYMKLWKGSFRDGTRMLSRPAKLLYLELLMLLDDHDGLIPNDLKWLVRNLGVHDARVVRAPLAELIEVGKISVTPDGLTNAKVSADLGVDADDDSEGGGGGDPERGPVQEELALPPTTMVHKPVEEVGAVESLSSDCASTTPPLRPHCGQWIAQPIDLSRCFSKLSHSYSYSYIHEVVVAESRFRARARGDPLSA